MSKKKYVYATIKVRVSPEQKAKFKEKAGSHKQSATAACLIREYNAGNIKI